MKTNGKTFRGIAVAGMFLIASGGAPGYTYAASGLPAGLSLDAATGEITGTPTVIAHTVFSATATDSSTNSTTLDFSLDVISRLDFEQNAPPPAERNYPYPGYQFNVKGATGTVTYAITSGSLPAGLSPLTSGGYIAQDTVTQSAGTDKDFIVTATDSGTGDTLDIWCVIHTYPEFKTTVSTTHNTITVGVPAFIDGGSAGYLGGVPPFKTTPGTLPSGLNIVFDTNTHGVTVTASEPFAQTLIHFTSTDALGFSPGQASFYLTAVLPNQKLVMKDAFGDVVADPGSITIKSTDNSITIDTSASSGSDTVYDLSVGGDSSGTPGSPLFFRSDQLIAVAGDDTLTLDQSPYDSASSTLTITINGNEIDYASDISFVGNVGTFSSAMIGGEIVVVRYWSGVIPISTTLTSSGGSTDPDFSMVQSLLHFEDGNGSTTFTDVTGRTWTSGAGTANSTTWSAFGAGSGFFNGSNQYISTPDDAALRIGTQDFCVEWQMMYPTFAGGYQSVISKGYIGSGDWLFQTGNGDGYIHVYFSGSLVCTESTGTINTGQGYAMRVRRVGSTVTVERDGAVTATGTSSANLNGTDLLGIGARGVGGVFSGQSLNAYVDEFRLTIGTARTALTVQSAPWPDS